MVNFVAEILVKSFQYILPKDILEGTVSYEAIPLTLLQEIYFHTSNSMDESSLLKKLKYMKEWVLVQLEVEGWQADSTVKTEKDGISIFDLIHCLAVKLLTVNQEKVVYRYKYLEAWHYLSGKIGTNLFAASMYARRDYKAAFQRKNFVSMDVLCHDNQVLNEVLERGISDNHCHLRCSSPYFILSWLSLMNSVTNTKISSELDKISEHPRNPKVRYRHSYQEDGFALRHLMAAAIRLYLYAFLTGEVLELGEYHIPVKWLLEHVCETESILYLCEEITVDQEIAQGRNLTQYLEIWQATQGNLKSSIENIQEYSKGFYWLFWDCYPEIPMECFLEGSKLLCPENIANIARYIEQEYKPLPLSQCAWLFQGQYQEKYRMEWDWQSKLAIKKLLSNPYELQGSREHIQHSIDAFHERSSKRQKDYALNYVEWEGDDWERSVVTGERWLIYQMEHRRFCYKKGDQERERDIYNLFFIYLTIKESFRSEILQNNDKIGFRNFQDYQKRKTMFTTAFLEEELAQIAVRGAFQRQNLKSMELRVMPQKNDIENIRMIRIYDEAIAHKKNWDCEKNSIHEKCGICKRDKRNKKDKWQKKLYKKYYYVIHFGKKEDNIKGNGAYGCRHWEFRKTVKQRSMAIMSMREKNPNIAGRLKGIDACSSEDGCRPEVFAVAFRELKAHEVYRTDTKQNLSPLRISYHVGEENQDILDGLRAIDEAVYFLNLESGDRLGHATMLGINVEKWYRRNQHMISIRQHDYLDNVAWLYHRIVYYHISNQDNLLEYLEHEFQVYFNRIYEQHMSNSFNMGILGKKEGHLKHDLNFNIHNYYYAWELRGDDPELYAEGFYQKSHQQGTSWGDQAINRRVQAERREIPEAAILYYTYHYNEKVRKEGEKPIAIKIPYYMMCGIAMVQKNMQRRIAKCGIAIETNPSSNLLIAGLAGYESHPILSFYNKGLVGDPAQIEECPQINVSINTDDQGTFTTSLYNEYTMMAGSLENLRGEDGEHIYKKDRVYDWINNVRKMGNKQAFSKEVPEEHRLGEGRNNDLKKD